MKRKFYEHALPPTPKGVVTLDAIRIENQREITNSGVISSDMFGVNLLTTQDTELISDDSFTADLLQLGATTIRFPGGSVTEDTFDMYSPNSSSHYDHREDSQEQLIPLEEFFNEMSGTNHTVSLVVPTSTAFGITAAEAMLLPESHTNSYGNRSSIDKAYIGVPYQGEIPIGDNGEIIFEGIDVETAGVIGYVSYALKLSEATGVEVKSIEIGNEFWGSGEMTAAEYGIVAGTVAIELEKLFALEEYSHFDVDILVQSTSAASILYSPKNDVNAFISREGDEYQVVSSALVEKPVADGGYGGSLNPEWEPVTINGQGGAKDQVNDIVRSMNTIEGSGDAIDGIVLHYYEGSGLDVLGENGEVSGPDNSKPFTFESFDQFNENLVRSDPEPLNFHVTEWNSRYEDSLGSQHASMLVEVFFEMAANGVDAAQTWPLTFDHQLRSLVDVDDADGGLSISGEMFSLMAESLVGLTPTLDWTNLSQSSYEKSEVLDVHGFSNEKSVVLFVSERSGADRDGLFLDLEGILEFESFFVTITELSDGGFGGDNPKAEPVLDYADGYISQSKLIAFNVSAWANVRIELTKVDDFDNTVVGRNGNDIIDAGEGSDALWGGLGNDVFVFSEGDGEDVISDFKLGSDRILINGEFVNDLGSLPDDLFVERSGVDAVLRYSGSDNLIISNYYEEVSNISHTMNYFTIFGTGDSDKKDTALRGGDQSDYIIGNGGDDQIYGNAGNDRLVDGQGTDNLSGGTGQDVFVLVPGDGKKDKIKDFEDGADLIDVSLMGVQEISELTVEVLSSTRILVRYDEDEFEVYSSNYVRLGREDFIFVGSHLSSINIGTSIEGSEFDDNLQGTFGSDKIVGMQGNDNLWSSSGDDWADLGEGKDTITSGDGRDTVLTGRGHDSVVSGKGADSVLGAEGNDTIWGGGNKDTVLGGEGNDSIGAGEGSDFVMGDKGSDTIFGSDGGDELYGNENGDELWAGSGQDTLFGGNGRDLIGGGIGDDSVVGGNGNDTLFGEDGADTMIAGGGNDEVWAGTGDDSLRGKGGNDSLGAGDGKDIVWGGDGDDQIWGGEGKDTLVGGSGSDTLTGGGGADVFQFTVDHGVDEIGDFELGLDVVFLEFSSAHLVDVVFFEQFNEVEILTDFGSIILSNVDSGADTDDFISFGF